MWGECSRRTEQRDLVIFFGTERSLRHLESPNGGLGRGAISSVPDSTYGTAPAEKHSFRALLLVMRSLSRGRSSAAVPYDGTRNRRGPLQNPHFPMRSIGPRQDRGTNTPLPTVFSPGYIVRPGRGTFAFFKKGRCLRRRKYDTAFFHCSRI